VLLARNYFDRRVALITGLVAALYWPLIYFEGEVLVEPLFLLLVVLSLWQLARAVSSPTLLRLAVAGVYLGHAALARPTMLVVLLVLPLAFRATANTAPRAWWRQVAVVVAACFLMLVPATIHNYRGSHAFVPVAWSGGLNLYIGNNPAADGTSAVIPDTPSAWMGGADEALGSIMSW
jgi:4-amino-4-deoxy-L-arabinose transferase-like glycosyltransferase